MNAPCPPVQNWPLTQMQVITRPFTASGPYMPTAGLVSATIECVGGGGAGGFVAPGGGAYGAAGGGGSGGYSRASVAAAMVRGGVIVTIGAGATSALGVNPSNQYGGTTSFGAICVAYGGGSAGAYDPAGIGSKGNPGVSAQGGLGDIAFRGSSGFDWSTVVIPVGAAGAGTYAQAGLGGFLGFGGNEGAPGPFGSSEAGLAGAPYSGAGGGGAVSNNGASFIGGAGGSGVCIVTEFVLVTTGDCDCQPSQARVPLWGCENG